MIIHLSFVALCMIVGLIWNRQTDGILERIDHGEEFKYKTSLTPWIIVFMYLTVLATLRSNINDSFAYRISFGQLETSWSAFFRKMREGPLSEWAFDCLGILFKRFISRDYHAWFGFYAVIESVLLINILRRESVSPLFSLLFFSIGGLYFNFFSMMRQWLAIIISFTGIEYVKKRRFIPFVIICIIAAQFHKSAYFMIPIYFVVIGEPWSIKQFVLTAVTVAMIYFLGDILNILLTESEEFTYDYAIEAMLRGDGSSPIRIAISSVPLVLAYMYREELKTPIEKACVNYLFAAFLCTIVATFTSGLLVIRFSTYCGIAGLLFYAFLIRRLEQIEDNNTNIIKVLFVLFYFMYYVYNMNHTGSWRFSSDIIGTIY